MSVVIGLAIDLPMADNQCSQEEYAQLWQLTREKSLLSDSNISPLQ